MSYPSDDAWLDEQLREIPLPDGLLSRLRGCLDISDQKLDARLQAVAVPHSLLARLHEVPADELLDAAVARVACPDDILLSLRQIAHVERRPARQSAVRRFALTSLLTAAAAVGFIAFTTSWLLNSYQLAGNQQSQQIVVVDAPWQLTAGMDQPETQFVSSASPSEWRDLEDSPSTWPTSGETLPISLTLDEAPLSGGPVSLVLAARAAGVHFDANAVLLRWRVNASPQRMEDDLPIIERTDLPPPSGMQPPLSRGYNRPFWLKHRVQPLMPTGVSELKTVAPPVVSSTRSMDRAQRLASAGAWPTPADVRPEEFLAASVRYPSPKPGQVALQAHGGPSRYGPVGTRLLQIGLQAGLPVQTSAQATDLILLLDASASMGRSGRWQAVRQSLAHLPKLMSPGDRVTLIAFTDAELLTLEDLRSSDIHSSLAALGKIRPIGSFDLAAAAEAAAATALAHEDHAQRRILIVTDDDEPFPSDLAGQLQSLMGALAQSGIALDVADTLASSTPQPHLLALAEWSGGRAALARDATELTWSLAGAMHGRQSLVASEVAWQVEFNPRRVAAYRVLGHEANAISTMIPGHLPADLRATEAATTLFEIWLADANAAPGSVGEKLTTDVATLRATWKEAATSERRSAERKVVLADFAATFSSCPAAFQTAAIAAETAEWLRGSRETLRELNLFSPRRTTLDDLRQDLRNVPAVPEMLEERAQLNRLLESLSKLRPR